MIGVGNYVIASSSELGNYLSADSCPVKRMLQGTDRISRDTPGPIPSRRN